MIRLKHPETTYHAQNCVKPERPQNKYIKPFQFKSREQNGGQLDPRINVGGRPKVLTEALARELRKKVEVEIRTANGQKVSVKKTRAELMAEALVDTACTMKPQSVAAFRTICELVEPRAEEERASTATALHMRLLEGFLRRAGEKPTDEL